MMAWPQLFIRWIIGAFVGGFLFSLLAIELAAQESRGITSAPPKLQEDLARFVPADLDVLAEFRDIHELLRAPEKSARLFASFKAALPRDQDDLWDQFESKLKILTPDLLKQIQPRLALGFRLESGIPTILVIWPASLSANEGISGPQADLHRLKTLTKSLCAAIPQLKLGELDTYKSAQRQELIDFGSLACRDGVLFWCSNPFLLRRCLRQDPKTSMAKAPGRKQLAGAFALRAVVGALRKHDFGKRINKVLREETALATLNKCWLNADLLDVELDWRSDISGSICLYKKGASIHAVEPAQEPAPATGLSLVLDSNPQSDEGNRFLHWALKWLSKRIQHARLQAAAQDLAALTKSKLTSRSAQRFGFYLPPAKEKNATDPSFYCGPAPKVLAVEGAEFGRYQNAFQSIFAARHRPDEPTLKYFSRGSYLYCNRSGSLSSIAQTHLVNPSKAAWNRPGLILRADLLAFESIVNAQGWADSPWVKPLLKAMKQVGEAWQCSLKATADQNTARISWIVKTPPRKTHPK